MTAWDGEKLLKALQEHDVTADKIDYVVCSHGHSDHIGNLNLFLNAKQFVGDCMNFKDEYFFHDLKESPLELDEGIELISTPGHTKSCVSVIVKNSNIGNSSTVALAGDLFEKEEDVFDESQWIDAGSEDENLQRSNRLKISEMADFIIPGHGPMFKVDGKIREKLKMDVQRASTST